MAGPTLEEYEKKYRHVEFHRENGILEVTLHSNHQSLIWGYEPHEELGFCFADIAADHANEVVILTGTGDAFCDTMGPLGHEKIEPAGWAHVYSAAKRLLNNLLSIEVPIIGAVNGPAHIHAELVLLSDIVIAAEHASFRDAPHFPSGLVPGDGVHVLWPQLLGPNRGRYFMLTGQTLDAREAMNLGVVSEVLPAAALHNRARELAQMVASRPPLTRRYARDAMTHQYKRLMNDMLGYGLALEGLAAADFWPPRSDFPERQQEN